MLGLFNPPKGLPYRDGFRVDAVHQGADWRGIVYDPHGVATPVDFAATTRAAALDRARKTVDGLIALQRRRWRG
jgi:hypothetical protein